MYFRDQFCGLIVRPHAHPAFSDPSYIMLTAMNVRCTMDVVLAVSALHLSVKNARFRRVSVEYYVSAIASLRTKVEGKDIDGTEDWLLLIVMLLCLFEVCHSGQVIFSDIHYSISTVIFSQ